VQSEGAAHADHLASAPEVDAYSLFMHHTVGAWLLVIGLLLLVHRLTGQRIAAYRVGIGTAWVLLGVFLFVKSDPEGWPLGPAGFLESFTMPSRWDWIQHKILAFLPISLGLCAARAHVPVPRSLWVYAAAVLALLGGLALTVHQHSDHPGAYEIINVQHRFLAINSLLVAGSLMLDSRERVTWRAKPYLMPAALLAAGLQLTFYVE
jgi:putative copper resistance protein D